MTPLIFGMLAKGAKALFGGTKKPTKESVGKGIAEATKPVREAATRRTQGQAADVTARAVSQRAQRKTPTAVARAIENNRRRANRIRGRS